MKAQFEDYGYVGIHKYFTEDQVRELEYHITMLYHTQCQKIGEHRRTFPNFSHVVNALESHDKQALYEAFRMIPQSPICREIFGASFTRDMCGMFGGVPFSTLIDGPSLFINIPGNDRVKAKWHTEALYYPKRRKFINIWMPLFQDRTKANGAMVVLPHSHKKTWDASLFAEYQGYNKDTEGKKDHLTQYEIPHYMLSGYEQTVCEYERGDIFVFDRNLVHTSAHNTTEKLACALVIRLFDVRDDLTLSADLAVTPYNGRDVGRSNLVVSI